MSENLSRTKRSSQAIDNFSFDEDFLVKVTELVRRNKAGTAIEYFNPATEENQDKTASYSISDIDESGTTKYYGYLNENGKWYIMEVTGTTVRYASGISLFSTNWANRIALTYGTFDNVF